MIRLVLEPEYLNTKGLKGFTKMQKGIYIIYDTIANSQRRSYTLRIAIPVTNGKIP